MCFVVEEIPLFPAYDVIPPAQKPLPATELYYDFTGSYNIYLNV